MPVYLAAGLNDADMIWLLSLGRLRKLARGDTLIAAGRPLDDLFFVLSGRLEVVRGDGVRVAAIGEGEVAGEMSFVGEEVPSVAVRALERCEVLAAQRREILERFAVEPALGQRFYRALAMFLASRLRETTAAVGLSAAEGGPEQSSAHAAGRFRRLLGSLAGRPG